MSLKITCCFLAGLSAWSTAAQSTSRSLASAIAAGLVDVRLSGTGANSGDAIKIVVTRLSRAGNQPLELSIPAGSRLIASDSASQNMVVAKTPGRLVGERTFIPSATITVPERGSDTYVVEAFCANFDKRNPGRTVSFRISSPDPVFACVLHKTARLSTAARQAALWIAADGVGFERMRGTFPVSADEYDAARTASAGCAVKVAR